MDELKEIMDMFDELKLPMPFKTRPGKGGSGHLKYIDARQVMDKFDDVVGPENWSDSYKEVKGNVYCTISIKVEEEWVSKSDCGTESNFEAEKGEASDAFKRAAVKWGIGRFLYEDTPVKENSASQSIIKCKGCGKTLSTFIFKKYDGKNFNIYQCDTCKNDAGYPLPYWDEIK